MTQPLLFSAVNEDAAPAEKATAKDRNEPGQVVKVRGRVRTFLVPFFFGSPSFSNDSTIIILYTSRSSSPDAHRVPQGLARERGVRRAYE